MKVGYARVSTEDQNLDLQLDALRLAECGQIYRDEGISGAAMSRPGLDSVLAALRPGDTLVTWRLDRLGRSLAHLLAIITRLEADGIAFLSLSEAIDTRTASGRLLFHVMGALAEFERSLISERTRAGIAAARARGRVVGRPPKLSPAQIEFASSALERGDLRIREVAAQLGVSPLTLSRALCKAA
jgi:DNA invertase Pin-like site-specific DNA recombinase